MKPNFDITLIVKNEERTLQRLFASLADYKKRGGSVYILDTGSTDRTVQVALKWGAKVTKVGDKFITVIDKKMADKINKRFVIGGEEPIVKVGGRLFDFAAARNHINSIAKSDFICTLDADEAYSVFDIDKINKSIEEGFEQFEYQFIYAFDANGNPAIQFVQSKLFNKKKVQWSGCVHEILQPINKEGAKIKYLDESILLLEHHQEQGKEHRGNYLTGLSLDCYLNPTKDRQSHYCGREMMYTGRYKSAIKEFKRHIKMGGWPAERAQSMIYMGQSYGNLNEPAKQLYWLHKAFDLDSSRREALIALAYFMKQNNNHNACAAYAGAALQIPWTDFYANNKAQYQDIPHALLYHANGWKGDIKGAKKHLLKALSYQPNNPDYLRDTIYYFEYPEPYIEGWMSFPELQWLYKTAKKMKSIAECGSWKGRSTHALLSGCKGNITAVDTWKGSSDPKDLTHDLAKKEDIFEKFKANTKDFTNLKICRKTSIAAAKSFPNKSFDMVFIDSDHSFNSVVSDIRAWSMKAKKILCGHDFSPVWPEVMAAVRQELGEPDKIHDTIWVHYIKK